MNDATDEVEEPLSTAGSASRMVIEIPAEPASVPRLRREVVAFLRRHGAGKAVLADVALATSEAVANVVRHAYHPGQRGSVRLVADLDGDDFEIVVTDGGHGVRAGSSSGLGQGLSIIATICDDFTLTPQPGGGLRVWMRFLTSR